MPATDGCLLRVHMRPVCLSIGNFIRNLLMKKMIAVLIGVAVSGLCMAVANDNMDSSIPAAHEQHGMMKKTHKKHHHGSKKHSSVAADHGDSDSMATADSTGSATETSANSSETSSNSTVSQ